MADKLRREYCKGDGHRPGQFWFYCPGCQHSHAIWPKGIEGSESKVQWDWNGSMESPTFHPSIKVTGGSNEHPLVCHFFVKEGKIEYCTDSYHALAGQTVEMTDADDYEG